MVLIASWTSLNLTPAATQTLTRSSHALIAHAGKAYIFGGELRARIPVDGAMHTLDLSSGQHSSIQIANSAEAPSPRVGTALAKVGDALYLWGGRGGKEMKPLSGELWKFELGRNESKWEKLATKGDQPEERSYHVLIGVQPVSVFTTTTRRFIFNKLIGVIGLMYQSSPLQAYCCSCGFPSLVDQFLAKSILLQHWLLWI